MSNASQFLTKQQLEKTKGNGCWTLWEIYQIPGVVLARKFWRFSDSAGIKKTRLAGINNFALLFS